MKNRIILMLAALLLLGGCALAEITSVDQLNHPGITVGTSLGAADLVMREELPEATQRQYTDNQLGYIDVALGRLDAFVYDRLQMELAIKNGLKGVRLLDENIGEPVHIAVGLSPIPGIPDLESRINAFIAELRADGTLQDMYRRWAIEGRQEMPEIELPKHPALHLRVGTSGIVPPYSYYVGKELNGFDIEMSKRFAAWLNADLEFKVYDYSAIINAALSGDVDCIMANLNVTPERAEVLTFSDTLYDATHGVMVRDTASSGLSADRYPIIGVQTGTTFDQLVKEKLPEAQLKYFNSKADLIAALTGQKISGFPTDKPVAELLMKEDDRLTFVPDYLDEYSYAMAFAKSDDGEALRDRFNAFLEQLPEGTLEKLEEKWFGEDDAAKTMPDPASLSAENGTLRLATEAGYQPFEYMRDGKIVGFDIELAEMFCEYAGYGLEIVDMNFDGILPSVQTGKCDFAAAGITITPERAESVLFSEPSFTGGAVLVVLKADEASALAASGQRRGESFWESIAASFEKTFIREGRWKLFVSGVNTTLHITILSILFGTALGFLVFMLCRNGNRAANLITSFCLWLVQGMPMVVLLMILYYVIFGSVSISGIVVAVLGFTLTFGSAVFGLLKMGVGAIDVGQYEAAYALGYSNRRTFFKIILPQAIPHVLPSYKGEIVSLIKATAVVGYIAVQDLTKMGDIVRSRTYEAFFPLIAVSIIYFVLEELIRFLIRRITVNANPKRRKPADILKGVKTDD